MSTHSHTLSLCSSKAASLLLISTSSSASKKLIDNSETHLTSIQAHPLFIFTLRFVNWKPECVILSEGRPQGSNTGPVTGKKEKTMVAQSWFGCLDLAYKYGYRISWDTISRKGLVAHLNANTASYSAHSSFSSSLQASSKSCTIGGGETSTSWSSEVMLTPHTGSRNLSKRARWKQQPHKNIRRRRSWM